MVDYSRLEFDGATERSLFDFAIAHKLGLAAGGAAEDLKPSDFKFHVTIFYSSVEHPDFVSERFDIEPIDLIPKQFQLFGPLNDHLVLEFVASESLLAIQHRYRRRYGHVSDFDPYRPHVTFRGKLSSNEGECSNLPLPDFPVRIARIVHEKRL